MGGVCIIISEPGILICGLGLVLPETLLLILLVSLNLSSSIILVLGALSSVLGKTVVSLKALVLRTVTWLVVPPIPGFSLLISTVFLLIPVFDLSEGLVDL